LGDKMSEFEKGARQIFWCSLGIYIIYTVCMKFGI